MLTAPRCLWIGILGSFLTGCTGVYKTVPIPTIDPAAENGPEAQVDIGTDDNLRLHLRDSSVVSGYLVRIDDGNLLLRDVRGEGDSNNSFTEIVQPEDVDESATVSYPLADIELIERHARDGFTPYIAAQVLAVAIVLVWAIKKTNDDLWKD